MNNTPAHLWALAVSGILTSINRQNHALLGGGSPSVDAPRGRTEALRRDWNVNDRAELLQVLTWLAHEGHRKDFNDVCKFDLDVSARIGSRGSLEDVVDDEAILRSIYFSRRHRARIGARSLLAWDMARLILLAGWGYYLQWISAGEAWSYVLPAAQAVQRAYGSWEDLGHHHLLGREYWAGEWVSSHAAAFRVLLDDPASPWRTLPWGTDLRVPNRMIPLQEIVIEPPPPPGPLATMRNPFPDPGTPDTPSSRLEGSERARADVHPLDWQDDFGSLSYARFHVFLAHEPMIESWRRLDRARVHDVCARLGYRDEHHFGKVLMTFLKYCGKSSGSDTLLSFVWDSERLAVAVAAQRQHARAIAAEDPALVAPEAGVTLDLCAWLYGWAKGGRSEDEALAAVGIDSDTWERAFRGWEQRALADMTGTLWTIYSEAYHAGCAGSLPPSA